MALLSSKKRSNNSLKDLCSEIFMLILQMRESSDYGDASILRNKILNLLDKFENRAMSSNIKHEKIQSVKFALVAFIDETIANSEWSSKTSWLAEPLQLKIFNCYNAGEEFFSRLESLRLRERTNIEEIEIYYLCLSLGYRGMYKMESPEKIRSIVDDLYYALNTYLGDPTNLLSPNGIPGDEMLNVVKEKIPLWIILSTIIFSGIVFYFVILFLISNYESDVADLIEKFLI